MTSHPEEHVTEPVRTGTVKVPGARLFYQVRGSGPGLMILCGGAAGVDGFSSVAPYLAASYTVVTYDRRGLSRSPLDHPGQDPAITGSPGMALSPVEWSIRSRPHGLRTGPGSPAASWQTGIRSPVNRPDHAGSGRRPASGSAGRARLPRWPV
jgi:hypothetical protein